MVSDGYDSPSRPGSMKILDRRERDALSSLLMLVVVVRVVVGSGVWTRSCPLFQQKEVVREESCLKLQWECRRMAVLAPLYLLPSCSWLDVPRRRKTKMQVSPG